MSWSIKLVRDTTFRETVIVRDDAGSLVPFASAVFTITPDDILISPIILNQVNGGLLMPSTGRFDFFISDTDTASYTWDSGLWCWHVVRSNGDKNVNYGGGGSVSVENGC